MITFETKVWEKDWEFILKGDYLKKMIESCNYNFTTKHIIINNVKNRHIVEKHCKKKIKSGIIDNYYVVEDYESELLRHFDIDNDSFNGGYNYSIAELLGIYICQTEYLLHFSGDSYPINVKINWIDDAISAMKSNSNILVANPTWNNKFEEAKNESFDEISDFYIGYGFSDQSYLIRKRDFDNKIYNEKNIESERYPKYGGELFEKRIDSYMRNNKKLRITHKSASYIHENFPKNIFYCMFLRDKICKQRMLTMENK